jgi:hypothetical protein
MEAGMLGPIGIGEFLVILFVAAVFAVIHVIPAWHILKKAGFKPTLSLLAVFPFMLTVGLYLVAFSKWPKETN